MAGNESVICCICGNQLPTGDSVLVELFPEPERKESQELFCHKQCLNKVLHETIPRHPELFE